MSFERQESGQFLRESVGQRAAMEQSELRVGERGYSRPLGGLGCENGSDRAISEAANASSAAQGGEIVERNVADAGEGRKLLLRDRSLSASTK